MDNFFSGDKRKLFEILRARRSPALVSERIGRHERTGHPPVSLAQQRLWFLEQLGMAGEAYHISAAVRLHGELDAAALQWALDRLVDRHEVLRTRFDRVGDQPVQIVEPSSGFALRRDEATSEAAVEAQLREEVSSPFDLARGPLMRGRLIKISAREHVLMVVMHHIVSDGWSMGIVIREFTALYAAYREGRENPLPTMTLQYADYAQWQRQWLKAAVLQEQLNYWREHLQGAPALLTLPTDHPRPAVQSHRGASVAIHLDASLSEGLRALSRRCGSTLFMTLYSGWALLLSRLSGQSEVVIGTAVANRERAELEGLIGFFVNTLALRVYIDDQTTQGLVGEVKALTSAGYEHQGVPFDQVVEAVQPPRSLSHSPLFQTMLVLQNTPPGELELPGLSLSGQGLPGQSSQFDLNVSLQEVGEEIVGGVTYASDLFERSTIERWMGYFTNLLQSMVAGVELPVSRLSLWQPQDAERARLLEAFNATAQSYPHDRLIHELFEAQVALRPAAIAVSFEEEHLSYAQLNARANQLAHYLRGRGVGPDTLVGLCVERSVEMVVGLLAILKAGGAYVPLDPSYPVERLSYLLHDAHPVLLLTQQSVLEQSLPAILPASLSVLCLDSQWDALASQSSENLAASEVGVRADHLMYVIYTSGSTGQPKGAMNSHRALVNRLQWMQNAYRLTESDRVLQKTPYSFDVSVWEFFWPLLEGVSLVVARPRGHQDPAYLSALIREQQITTVHFVPSMLESSVEYLGAGRTPLRQIVCSGEELPTRLQNRCLQLLPRTKLHNLYGPTEAAVDVTSWQCEVQDASERVSIGRPIWNTQIYIVDEENEPVPQGVVGEIYIGGAAVARGYLNRPELTAQRFVADPFQADGSRLYKTGDLGRWRADGAIEYLGRNDHQVKLRGYRIELGEIESRLCTHARVREAVVLARESAMGKQLVAYVTPAIDGSEPMAEELRNHLQDHLPSHMVPSAYVVLAQLPLSPNGKLDRRALPAPNEQAYKHTQYEAPVGEIEEALAGIWRELLQIEQVGRADNFFELGGHSLLIVQLVERLRGLQLSLDVRSVFDQPQLSALAAQIARGTQSRFVAPTTAIPTQCEHLKPEMLSLVTLTQEQLDQIVSRVPGGARNVQDIYPLAPLQEGILFHHLLNKRIDAYVLPMLLSVSSREVLQRLLSALQQVVDRHDVLRTGIMWEGLPQAVQVVHRHAKLAVREVTLSASHAVSEQLSQWLLPQRLRMDLNRAPLLPVQTAADPQSERWYVLLQLHHIISDHVGLEIIVEEVRAVLSGRGELLPPSLPYREHVAHALWLNRSNDAESYFRRRLSHIDEPTAPYGLLDVHGDGSAIEEHRREVLPELSRRIRQCSRALGMSAATLFHAGYAMVVSATSGRDEVVFGSVLSGRLQGTAGANRALGMFINTLPVCVQVGGEATVLSCVREMQQGLIELLRYEQASLAQAQRCSGIEGSAPLFTALLNYRHSGPGAAQDAEPGTPDELSGIDSIGGYERTNYPLTLSVDDFGAGFALTALVDRRLDAQALTGYLEEAMSQLVTALAQEPQRRMKSLRVLPSSERARLLAALNATAASYPQDRLIHELFEAQVSRRPDALAVSFDEEHLSYAQLNKRANQLAHYLRAREVGPDTLVGLCMERGVDMVVGLLAILKAGGAYVPLDPSYPAERLSYLLQDASPALLLTQQSLLEQTLLGILPESLPVLCLDSQWDELARESGENLATSEARADQLAYVIYTSGSTGQPKGVPVTHANVTRLFASSRSHFEFGEHDVATLFHSIAFDFSVWELWSALLHGGRAVVVSHEVSRTPQRFYRLLCEQAVTALSQTPSAFSQLIAADEGRASSLRVVVFGGEALQVQMLKPWVERHGDHAPRLINMYGITETTVHVTYQALSAEMIEAGGSVVGTSLDDLQIYLLDSEQELVPIGVTGEIYVGGAGLARGYLNRPELTAQRFVADPFKADGSRLYKSGDLGRRRADGSIEYLGRNDHQVKIRGYRIELGEIESRLRTHEQVREAVVLAREGVTDKQLVAYVTPALESSEPTAETLRSHLQNQLPSYMVPSAYVVLEQLPLTSNGKLDRRALPAPDAQAYQHAQYEAPVGEIEEALAGIWRELLQVAQVGRADNFFELGGHSLLIVQLMERLRRLQLSLEVRSVFDQPQLSALASLIARGTGSRFVAPANAIPEKCDRIEPAMLPLIELSQTQLDQIVARVPGGASNVQDIYPLAPLQEGILFHHLLNERIDTYVLPMLLSVSSHEQLGRLLDALQQVVNRHDVLRTGIVWEGLPQAVQVVHRHAQIAVREVTLSASPAVSQQLSQWLLPQHLRMDLSRAPLLQLQIASDPQSARWYVLLQLHHMISDHQALEVLIEEVRAHLRGEAAQLPPSLPYREYVAHALSLNRTNDVEHYFRRRLGHIDEPTAPYGLLDVHGDGSAIQEHHRTLLPELSQRIRHCARALGMSAAALFHAACALVVSATSGRDEVVFGSVLSGRLQGTAGADRALGMFINTLPVTVQLGAEVTVLSCVRKIQQELIELLRYEQASLAHAQRCSGIEGNAPLFTALLNYRHSGTSPEQEAPKELSGIESIGGYERTNYPLSLSVDDLGEGFALTAYVDRRLDAQALTGYLQEAMAQLVMALEQEPQRRMKSLRVLPPSERTRLLEAFNATASSYPQDRLVHELFEAQVQLRPDAIAVSFEDEQVSYGQLNARANQLAHYLRARGVTGGESIALSLPRGIDQLVAQLGVLKLGCTYVPIDPQYPAVRQQFMVEDSGALFALVSQALLSWTEERADAQWISLTDSREEISTCSTSDLGAASPSPAYVMYTSGSTGVPKGVVVEHQSIVRLAINNGYAQIGAGDVVAHGSNPAFDASTFEVWGALLNGARVHILPQSTMLDPNALARALSSYGVRTMFLTTALFNQCVMSVPTMFSHLKHLLFGGEVCDPNIVGEVLKRGKPMHLLHVYGPTESTTFATAYPITAVDGENVPIGRPISNTQIYIVDEEGEPVPCGVTGEIHIAGAGVARGYLNRPELTAQRFVVDPFSPDPGARLYKTGDLGRWRADGMIEYLGRNDHQVKIRGYRIELGEIESRLRTHAQVREAVVLARESATGKQLVAYVTPAIDGLEPTAAQLRSYLQDQLPSYMVPSAYVALMELPLSPTGKVNRLALSTIDIATHEHDRYSPPIDDVEASIAAIWGELLQMPKVGRHDNFFELGGHSLSAIRALVLINEKHGSSVALQALLQAPTIAEIGRIVRDAESLSEDTGWLGPA